MKPATLALSALAALALIIAAALVFSRPAEAPSARVEAPPSAATARKAAPAGLKWHHKFKEAPETVAGLDEMLASAQRDGKPVMIDFYADWCVACKELDRKTYVDGEVVSELGRFLNVKIDATKEAEAIETLYKRYGIESLPTVLFVSSEGKILEDPRVTQFLAPDVFLAELRKVR